MDYSIYLELYNNEMVYKNCILVNINKILAHNKPWFQHLWNKLVLFGEDEVDVLKDFHKLIAYVIAHITFGQQLQRGNSHHRYAVPTNGSYKQLTF
jgi:hypothetical protein